MEQETTAAPKTFVIKNLVDVDPMTIYRETAKQMQVGQLVDGLGPDESAKLVRAIVEIHGERTYRTETYENGGLKRVIRVEQRPLKARAPKAKKGEAPKKPAAKNG